MKLQRNTSFGIAAILLFAGITNLKAQTAPSVKMGVRVSPNFSWMNIQEGPMSNDGLGLGFSYGVTADFAMFKSTNYWMGTELSVSTIPVNVKSNSELRNKVTIALPTGGTRDSIYKYPNGNYKNYGFNHIERANIAPIIAPKIQAPNKSFIFSPILFCKYLASK
jgi:hypothetical protein